MDTINTQQLDKLKQRNNELEGALLLAQRDVKTLKDFLLSLNPKQGKSKLLDGWQVEELYKHAGNITPPCINVHVLERIKGALTAVGMVGEAEYLQNEANSIHESAKSNARISEIIINIIKDGANDFSSLLWDTLDKTGGQYARDYLGTNQRIQQAANATSN